MSRIEGIKYQRIIMYIFIFLCFCTALFAEDTSRKFAETTCEMYSFPDAIAMGCTEEIRKTIKALIATVDDIKQTEELAKEKLYEPLAIACRSTLKIWAEDNCLGLTPSELLEIAFFIETELPSYSNKGATYFRKEQTGLSRTIEYDPKTKYVYIHLKKHNLDKIGRGCHKCVTKSIRYDREHPEMVANCVAADSLQQEIDFFQRFSNELGICRSFGAAEHVKKDGTKVSSLFLKLYRGENYARYLKFNGTFSEKDKLYIAYDLLCGLTALHEAGFVHRDLHSANFLLDRNVDGMMRAVIIDFEKTLPLDKAKGLPPEQPRHLRAPEVCVSIPENLDYRAAEVYAMGCNLYSLILGKKPDWCDTKVFVYLEKQNVKKREALSKELIKKIDAFISDRSSLITAKHITERTPSEQLELVLLDMIASSPERRLTAKAACERVRSLTQL